MKIIMKDTVEDTIRELIPNKDGTIDDQGTVTLSLKKDETYDVSPNRGTRLVKRGFAKKAK